MKAGLEQTGREKLKTSKYLSFTATHVIAPTCPKFYSKSMLFHRKACPDPPEEAKQGSSTLSPWLRRVLHFHTPGHGGDRSRGLYTWSQYSLTLASPALTAANQPISWMLFRAAGSRETRGALFATLLLGKTAGSQALGLLSGKKFWIRGCWLSPVTLFTCR